MPMNCPIPASSCIRSLDIKFRHLYSEIRRSDMIPKVISRFNSLAKVQVSQEYRTSNRTSAPKTLTFVVFHKCEQCHTHSSSVFTALQARPSRRLNSGSQLADKWITLSSQVNVCVISTSSWLTGIDSIITSRIPPNAWILILIEEVLQSPRVWFLAQRLECLR